MPTITDKEFGEISIRRSNTSKSIKLKVGSDGQICISMPMLTPLFLAKSLVNQSRQQIKNALKNSASQSKIYQHGDTIGKLHQLIIQSGDSLSCKMLATKILVTAPATVDQRQLQDFIKPHIKKSFKKQAAIYLTPRIQKIAEQNNFNYNKLRFNSAASRWGSCSSTGTISLNIWLLKLPDEVIDYVIVHELCHTCHMDHSPKFWTLVESIVPSHKLYRKVLKQHQPRA